MIRIALVSVRRRGCDLRDEIRLLVRVCVFIKLRAPAPPRGVLCPGCRSCHGGDHGPVATAIVGALGSGCSRTCRLPNARLGSRPATFTPTAADTFSPLYGGGGGGQQSGRCRNGNGGNGQYCIGVVAQPTATKPVMSRNRKVDLK